jgi:hypothetical protein
MLSKFEYGVIISNLIETINSLASIKNITVVIKPHTRGMEVAGFLDCLDSNVVLGEDYSSSELISWSDFVFFTGSSIVFQGLILNKMVVYLKFCQKYQTIYDNSDGLFVVNNLEDILKIITNYQLSVPLIKILMIFY